MLIEGSPSIHWTERGDLNDGREEEGRQEGGQEEEVGCLGDLGGWTDHPPASFS